MVVPTVGTTVSWPRDSQKLDLHINEEGMYELLFSSQQPKAKDFKRYCCNVLFPHVRQQLTNKIQEEHQQTTQAVTIKHRPLRLQMKHINRKF